MCISPNTCFLGLPESTSQTVSRLVQPFLHSSRQNDVGHPQACQPFPCRIWTPSNTWFLGPTRAHNPNGISIGSAVFAQLAAERPYTLQWAAVYPQNYPFPRGDLMHDSFGVSESTTQTASRLSHFLHSSPQCSRAYPCMSFPLKIVPSHGAIRTPHPSQWLLGPS